MRGPWYCIITQVFTFECPIPNHQSTLSPIYNLPSTVFVLASAYLGTLHGRLQIRTARRDTFFFFDTSLSYTHVTSANRYLLTIQPYP
jgi:hypothetical protein